MARPKGYVFPASYAVECPVCGETKKNKSGLRSHVERAHGVHISNVDEWLAGQGGVSESQEDQPIPTTTSPSNKQLRDDLERARLTGELARLGASPRSREPSVTEKLGLGPETHEFEVQSQLAVLKGLGIGGQQKEGDSLLEKLAVQVLTDKISDKNQGSNSILELLKGAASFLGVNGRDIWDFVNRTKTPGVISDGHFKIGDMTVPSGVMITPGLYEKMIEEQGLVERAKIEAAGREKMADTADRVFGYLAPLIADKFGEGASTIAAKTRATPKSPATAETHTPSATGEAIEASAEPEPEQLVRLPVICPSCGTERGIEISGNHLRKGSTFMFSCECGFEDVWAFEPGRGPEDYYLGPAEPEKCMEVTCVECAKRGIETKIAVSSLTPTGATVKCSRPGCQYEFVVTEQEKESKPERKKAGGKAKIKDLKEAVEVKTLERQLEDLEMGEKPPEGARDKPLTLT